jgi:hypothetical protein
MVLLVLLMVLLVLLPAFVQSSPSTLASLLVSSLSSLLLRVPLLTILSMFYSTPVRFFVSLLPGLFLCFTVSIAPLTSQMVCL